MADAFVLLMGLTYRLHVAFFIICIASVGIYVLWPLQAWSLGFRPSCVGLEPGLFTSIQLCKVQIDSIFLGKAIMTFFIDIK
jgi:hypothetical protein